MARPAAQEQLKVLGEQAGVATLPIVAGQRPVEIARRAMEAARFGGFDVVLLDVITSYSIHYTKLYECNKDLKFWKAAH